MAEFDVGSHTYRTKKINARGQLFLLHAIGPLFGPMVQYAMASRDTSNDGDPAASSGIRFTGSFFRAFAQMQKSELTDLTNQVMAAVQRRAGGNGQGDLWVDMWNGAAERDQFEDYDLVELVRISWAVLQENLGGFFATGLAMVSEFSVAGLPVPSPESSGSVSPMARTS